MTLKHIAREMLQAVDMDINKARSQINKVLNAPENKPHFLAFIREALLNELRLVWITQREPRPVATGPTESTLYRSVLSKAAQSLMDFPLSPSSGITLGDATKSDILEWTSMQKKSISTQATHVIFVESVGDGLKSPKQKVKTQFTEMQLEKLFDKAKKEALELFGMVTA